MIDVILTGGTAACSEDGRGRLVPGDADRVASLCRDWSLRSGVPVDVRPWTDATGTPLPPRDSCDMDIDGWRAIRRALDARPPAARASLVVHGTDTMAYTAALLGLLQERDERAIVLTGAQRAPGIPDSDLAANLALALDACAGRHGDLAGETVIAFSGQLFRGVRSTKTAAARIEAFASPDCPPLTAGQPGVGVLARWAAARPAIGVAGLALGDRRPRIAVLTVTPGFAADWLARLDVDGVILGLYGAGTAPVAESLARQADCLARRGIACLARSSCLTGGIAWGRYGATAALESSALIDGGDMTLEAATAKLAAGLSAGLAPDRMRGLLEVNLAGERHERTAS